MTYYTTSAGAKVFSAGVMNFGGSSLWPTVCTMLENLWGELSGVRRLTALVALAAAGALVSCGSGRPRPTTTAPTASSRPDHDRRPTAGAAGECGAAVADVRRRRRPPAYGRRARAAAAVPAALDVPRPRAARVPARRRLRERLRGGVRRPALLDRPCNRPHALALHRPPLRLVVAGARRPSPLRHLHRQPRVPGDAAERRARRVLAADRPHPLAARDRPSESSPLVADGTVYVADQDGYVYAFAARTGRLRWRFAHGAPIKASPSLAYGRIYIGNYAGEMFALAARTGRLSGAAAATATSTPPPRSTPDASTSARSTAASMRSRPGRSRPLELRDGKLCLRLTGCVAWPRPGRLLRPRLLRTRRRHRLAPLDVPRPRRDLRRRLRRRRHRLLLELRPPHLRAASPRAATCARSGPTASTRLQSPATAPSTSSASAGSTRSVPFRPGR